MDKITVKIFTEGGSDIGLGHITRCCSLYDEAATRGNVIMYIRGDISTIKFLENYHIINIDWTSREYLESQISSEDYCIVDSYLANKSVYNLIADMAKKALYIDDMNRIDYPKGIVVNPSLSIGSICYLDNKECRYLWGTDYVILRNAFKNIGREQVNVSVKKVLITMGGLDSRDLTQIILNEIGFKYNQIEFNVVISGIYSILNKTDNITNKNIKFHYDINETKMRDLMVDTDFAITAAGQTIYELIATKTPFIPIQTADNQSNNINSLFDSDLIISSLNHLSLTLEKELNEKFHQFLDYNTRLSFVENCQNTIDGNGSIRIINELIDGVINTIYLRKIVNDDCDLLYKWANDKLVRKNAFITDKIDFDSHKKWFQSKLNCNTTVIYIALEKNLPIGQIRIDIEDQKGIIDYSISSNFRNRGLGTVLLKSIGDQVKKDCPTLKKLIGRVKKENIPSQKAFEKALYKKRIEKMYYEYELLINKDIDYKN
jgi:spore coat polysaccharide biosynthesis predicted glycosyltransferase SpsG/RimJ/RimL family protein N-acetyltransferase